MNQDTVQLDMFSQAQFGQAQSRPVPGSWTRLR